MRGVRIPFRFTSRLGGRAGTSQICPIKSYFVLYPGCGVEGGWRWGRQATDPGVPVADFCRALARLTALNEPDEPAEQDSAEQRGSHRAPS
jgi:hypothetical protein